MATTSKTSAARTVYHLLPTERGWELKRTGGKRPTKIFAKKTEAMARGVELAKARMPGQLIIHGANGRIESERTYGNDPKRFAG